MKHLYLIVAVTLCLCYVTTAFSDVEVQYAANVYVCAPSNRLVYMLYICFHNLICYIYM